jgi:hypothetical protein
VGKLGSEQSTWVSGDPHVKAYRILFNDHSQRIMHNLGRGEAHRDASCLACHGPASNACFDSQPADAASDGVGCDSCHGNSERWLSVHFESGWKSLSDSEKQLRFGFRNTKNLVTRITMCTSCHVGDASREVNHDLIAAGHPRLAFEFTRYHTSPKYVKHWTESQAERDIQIKGWFIGQVATLRASVELAEVHSRANATHPELAERSCFACHQSLDGTAQRSSGRAAWQPWAVGTLVVLERNAPVLFPDVAPLPTDRLRQLNTLQNLADPSPVAIHELARDVRRDLERWLNEASRANSLTQPVPADAVRSLAASIALSAAQQPADWDALAIHYLSAAALHHADQARFAGWTQTLDQLRDKLRYRQGYDSPRAFDREAVRGLFQQLHRSAGPDR